MFLDSLLHAKILIVDDDLTNIRMLEAILHAHDYTQIKSAHDPRGVLALYVEFEPDLIILDLNMPYISGLELLNMIRPLVGDEDYLPVLVITAEHSYDTRREALTSGASDLLVKPYLADEVCVRIGNMLRLRFHNLHLQDQLRQRIQEMERYLHEMEQYQQELKEAQLETIARLARAAEHRDDETGKHTQRVGLLCSMLARGLNWPDQNTKTLGYAASLHDVGKIGVPDSILLKPGNLTDVERKIMRRHCAIGAELLSGGHSDIIRMAERIALTHHERWDGQGYPHGLQAEEIPIEGRILAIADVFDALTHERPYKKAWTIERALGELKNLSGQHLDPQLVDCFVELAGIRRRVLGRRVSGRRELSVRGADVPAKVLVVDDERDIVAFIKVNLERAGYHVTTAENGREALERVAADKPDLILLDQMMPEMDGLEVLKNLKGDEATDNIPVVMLTAIDAPADVVKGWESGTALYLVKPIMPKELLEFIQCVLE